MIRFLLQLFALFAIFFAENASASVRDLGARQPSDAVLALPNDFLLAPDGSLFHPQLGLPLNGLRSSNHGLEINKQVIEGLEAKTYMIIAAPAAYLVSPVGWVVIGAGTGGAEAWGSVGNYLATGESNYGAGDAALALIGMVPFGAWSSTPRFAAAAAKAGALGSKGLAGAREALNASRLAKAINCGPVARGLARNGWVTTRCFPGDTLASGKRMDQYHKDEMLTAWDDAKNAFVQARITQIFVHEHDGEFAEVTLTSGASLKPTAEHPFRLAQAEQLGARPAVVFDAPQEGTYIAARYLRTGDLLLTPQGPIAVTSIRLVHDKIKVYNFEVEGLHNYTVGADGVVVHNACGADIAKHVANYEQQGMKYLVDLKNRGLLAPGDITKITALRQMNIIVRNATVEATKLITRPQFHAMSKSGNGWLEPMFKGSAVEKAARKTIEDSSRLSKLFIYTGSQRSVRSLGHVPKSATSSGGFVDFVGAGPYSGLRFDLTTPAMSGGKYLKYGPDVLVPTYNPF